MPCPPLASCKQYKAWPTLTTSWYSPQYVRQPRSCARATNTFFNPHYIDSAAILALGRYYSNKSPLTPRVNPWVAGGYNTSLRHLEHSMERIGSDTHAYHNTYHQFCMGRTQGVDAYLLLHLLACGSMDQTIFNLSWPRGSLEQCSLMRRARFYKPQANTIEPTTARAVSHQFLTKTRPRANFHF